MTRPPPSNPSRPSSKPSKKKTTPKAAPAKPVTRKAPAKRAPAKKPALSDQPASTPSAPTGAAASRAARQQAAAQEFAVAAARMLADDKCRDVVILDVRGRSQVTDYTVIATGTSDRQMRAAGEHVDELGSKTGMKLYRHTLRDPDTKWVLLDFVDVVVHVFEPDARLYYDLEMLWGDAPRIAWERPNDLKARAAVADSASEMSRDRAGLRRGRSP